MKKLTISILTIALFYSMSANAAYKIYIPIEAKLGGSLPDNTLAWVGGTDGGTVGGGGGDDGSTIDPTPEEPEKPQEPESKPERKLVTTLNFFTVSGETNLFTSDKQNGFVVQTSTFALKGALKQDQNYYVTNNGNECKYVADVCTMNVNCVYSKASLSGTYTILSISPSQAKACLNTNYDWGQKALSNVTVYDNPKSE